MPLSYGFSKGKSKSQKIGVETRDAKLERGRACAAIEN
jgi:hypothetical protein